MNESLPITRTCNAYSCRLFMAGDIAEARRVTGRFCRDIGFCVTVTPTDYVYSGGQESGFIIEAINYARFPQDKQEIHNRIHNLAKILALELNQKSYSITDDLVSEYISIKMPFEK